MKWILVKIMYFASKLCFLLMPDRMLRKKASILKRFTKESGTLAGHKFHDRPTNLGDEFSTKLTKLSKTNKKWNYFLKEIKFWSEIRTYKKLKSTLNSLKRTRRLFNFPNPFYSKVVSGKRLTIILSKLSIIIWQICLAC